MLLKIVFRIKSALSRNFESSEQNEKLWRSFNLEIYNTVGLCQISDKNFGWNYHFYNQTDSIFTELINWVKPKPILIYNQNDFVIIFIFSFSVVGVKVCIAKYLGWNKIDYISSIEHTHYDIQKICQSNLRFGYQKGRSYGQQPEIFCPRVVSTKLSFWGTKTSLKKCLICEVYLKMKVFL